MKEYLLNYGRTGEIGRFRFAATLPRGGRVLVRTPRGAEIGTVLRPVTPRLAEMMGGEAVGEVLRLATGEDLEEAAAHERLAADLLARAAALGAGVALLDAEVLVGGERAILYHAGRAGESARDVIRALSREFRLTLTLSGLGDPAAEGGSCGSGDCGSGGCGSGGCGSGGGCGTCGTTSAEEVREYFAGLRDKMDTRRVTIL